MHPLCSNAGRLVEDIGHLVLQLSGATTFRGGLLASILICTWSVWVGFASFGSREPIESLPQIIGASLQKRKQKTRRCWEELAQLLWCLTMAMVLTMLLSGDGQHTRGDGKQIGRAHV